MTSAGRLATAFAIVLIASCGGSTVSPGGAPGDAGNPSMDGGGSSSGGGDAGTDGDATADAPAEPPDDGPWPAKHYPIPQMVDFGGPVIASPKIVTVTFQGQPNRDNERAFDDMIGGSAWWSAALAGYGIGAGQGGIYADLPDTVSNKTLDDTKDLQPMIQQWVTGNALPPPDENTIYVMYFPQSTTITLGNTQSCNGFGGYHNSASVQLGDGGFVDAAYAVIPDCFGGGQFDTDTITHELGEATTDPHPMSGLTYFGYDDAWWQTGGGEVGDNCQNRGPVTLPTGDFAARIWNNAAAAASSDPCQPADPAGEIFYGAAVPTQVVSGLTGPQGGVYASDGYIVMRPGQTKTLDTVIFSEKKLPNDLQLVVGARIRGDQVATDVAPIGTGINPTLSPTSGHNGMHVTFTLQLDPSATPGDYPFVVRAILNANDFHNWPVILRVL